MVFFDLLKSQGLQEEQIAAISNEMRRNRIFVTYEEKIEERYIKLKLQRDNLRIKLDLAEKAFEELYNIFKVNEDTFRKMNCKSKGRGSDYEHDKRC